MYIEVKLTNGAFTPGFNRFYEENDPPSNSSEENFKIVIDCNYLNSSKINLDHNSG